MKSTALTAILLLVVAGALLVAGFTMFSGTDQEDLDVAEVQPVFPESAVRGWETEQADPSYDMTEERYQMYSTELEEEPAPQRTASRRLSALQRESLLSTALPMGDDPRLGELGLYESVSGNGFRIVFNTRIDHVHIQILRTPPAQYREAAEEVLADLLAVEVRDLCRYSVSVSAPGIYEYGLSACPSID